MKCPKCSYLGFETGDRCKNCGYNFSLMQQPEAALPLFAPPREDEIDDTPLVKLPVAPRAPLAVRRTPDTPRTRAAARHTPAVDIEPVLQFAEDGAAYPDLQLREPEPFENSAPAAASVAPPNRAEVPVPAASAVRRLAAAAIDHAILFAVDAAVLYFTLRIASLPATEIAMLPLPPLIAFLLILEFAYFTTFTAVGGQTVGKMAVGLRVVTDAHRDVDIVCAMRRAVAGAIALATCGVGFVPALVGDRRALHDRAARTMVVPVRSA